jgi:hypothetical protein
MPSLKNGDGIDICDFVFLCFFDRFSCELHNYFHSLIGSSQFEPHQPHRNAGDILAGLQAV